MPHIWNICTFHPITPNQNDPDGTALNAELAEHGLGKNSEYDIMIIEWQGIVWSAVSIPKEKMEVAEKMAKIFGLRITKGIPAMIGGELSDFERVPFPNYANVYRCLRRENPDRRV